MDAVRQGWRNSTYVAGLFVLLMAACEESAPYEVEEDTNAVFFVEQYPEKEEFPLDGQKEFKNEGDFYYTDQDAEPPTPELSSVPPVGDVISDQKWEDITDGISFERVDEEKPKERPVANPGIDFGEGVLHGLSTLSWVLVIVLILGFLAWLITRSKVDTSVNKVRDFSLTDELLASSKEELADALTQNLNSGDYRGAIRYRFGQLLQAMRKKGLLVWVPGRTNAEYQRSLQATLFEPFGVLAKAFSYAMYSGKGITQSHYDAFASNADSFLTLCSQLELRQAQSRLEKPNLP